MTFPCPQPGWYPDVPAPDYHRWDAVSSTLLKKMADCPAKAKQYLDTRNTDEADTPALVLGRAIHDAVLLPDAFSKEWIGAPKIDRRTKKGKEDWAAFVDMAGDRQVLSADDFGACVSITRAVYANPIAHQLLTGKGRNEISLAWDDEETGLRSKARVDRYTGYDFGNGEVSTHVDIKTTDDASPVGFRRSIAKYKYHLQAAFYLDGCRSVVGGEREFVFIAVEKKPPYAVGVYWLEHDAIDQGRREYRKALDQYRECLNTNDWPGYTIDAIAPISLPSYALEQEVTLA